MKNDEGQTLLSFSCEFGHVFVMELLLKDPRVDITVDDHNGRTPLWWATCNGHLEVVEWLIASGRDLGDIKNKKGKSPMDDKEYTALEMGNGKKG